MSFPLITDVKLSSQNILFYFIYQPDTHYQQDACQKTGQKSKHLSKFQRRKKQPTKALLWQIGPKLNVAKGKTCKKMLIFDHQCVSFE
jgi:hypothetical protein